MKCCITHKFYWSVFGDDDADNDNNSKKQQTIHASAVVVVVTADYVAEMVAGLPGFCLPLFPQNKINSSCCNVYCNTCHKIDNNNKNKNNNNNSL